MNDIAQVNLAPAPQVDWENYGKSGYQVPPPAFDAGGKAIVYYGIAEKAEKEADELSGVPLLSFNLDPIVLVGEGQESGYVIRFTHASVRPYGKKQPDGTFVPKKGNPNRLADFLRSTGLTAKPQTNEQYEAAVKQVVSMKKKAAFTIDWEARSKETGEKVSGYNAFPIDPITGLRKAILKAGDFYNVLGPKGMVIGQAQVKSDVLFANAKVGYFRDLVKG